MRLLMLTLIPFLVVFMFLSLGCSLRGGFRMVSGLALMIISLLASRDGLSLSLDELSGMGRVGSAVSWSLAWKLVSLLADCRGGVWNRE